MRKKVLFLSSANGARSQMAEAFLRTLAADGFDAYSAGTRPRGVHPMTIAVMAERGIDIGGQQAKGLQEFMGIVEFDSVITVCERIEKECPVFPGRGTREFWSVGDPVRAEEDAEEAVIAFREARDHIEERVRSWLVERRYKPFVQSSLQAGEVER